MPQQQESTRHHYRAIRERDGYHAALIAAARDVDELRDALGRKRDKLTAALFGAAAGGFGLGLGIGLGACKWL